MIYVYYIYILLNYISHICNMYINKSGAFGGYQSDLRHHAALCLDLRNGGGGHRGGNVLHQCGVQSSNQLQRPPR